MENSGKCVIFSKKEYDELRSQSNIPSLKIVVDFGYRWRGAGIHVSGTLDPSEKLYYQIRRICDEIFEKTHKKEYFINLIISNNEYSGNTQKCS